MTDQHLDDEELSAHLDGESTEVADGAPGSGRVDAHIAVCTACRLRLAALEATSALVRVPVAPVTPAAPVSPQRGSRSAASAWAWPCPRR